jgi:hypothetical protein
MKRILLLVLLLAASAPAQDIILGVLETGDYTITMDTVTFFWGTLPDAGYIPSNWGGGPGRTDTFEFELFQPAFPAHVWLDYTQDGRVMPRETIIGLVPDNWYELPRFDKAPTRVKFLRQPGIEEGRQLPAHGLQLAASPNPFRGSLRISLGRLSTGVLEHFSLRIFDASGRLVRSLPVPQSLAPSPYSLFWDGRDQSGREVAAGVYVCRVQAKAPAPALRLVKLD